MTIHELDALVADIVAAPDDDAPRLVYADALMQAGDPRGEQIALSCALAAADASDTLIPDENRIAARERALRAEHAEAWIQPLREFFDGGFELRRGFVEHVVAIKPHDAEVWAALRDALPLLRAVTLHDAFGLETMLPALGPRLEELAMFDVNYTLAEQLPALLAGCPRLSSLAFERSAPSLVAIEGIVAACPQLVHLGLDVNVAFRGEPEALRLGEKLGGYTQLRSLSIGGRLLPSLAPLHGLVELERLALRDVDRPADEILALVRALPRLTTIDLESVGELDMAAFFEAAPSLRRLRLANMSQRDELVGMAALPALRRLRRLAVIGATRRGAEALARSPHTAELLRLDLGRAPELRPLAALRTRQLYVRPRPLYPAALENCEALFINAIKEYRLLSNQGLAVSKAMVERIRDELANARW